MFSNIRSYIDKISPHLESNRFRQVIAFHASPEQDNTELEVFICSLPQTRKLIISPSINQALPAASAKTCLGEEYDLVVFDIRESIDVDALGVVSGVLCGGGFILLVLPEKQQWVQASSQYTNHVKTMLNNKTAVFYFENEVLDKSVQLGPASVVQNTESLDAGKLVAPFKTLDQQMAVDEISRELSKQKKCCVVLTSGRGRGKSSSLGFLSAKLISASQSKEDKSDSLKILVTAPRRTVADPLFKHLQQQCPQGELKKSVFTYKNSEIRFIAPDALLESLPEAKILFVDEAAAIPISMLEKLLGHYSGIIFSTTTHGYEGTGRGFLLKFYKMLSEKRPEWKERNLHQPIRWAREDPLEKWIEEVLFLNVRLSEKIVVPDQVSQCEVKLLETSELIKNKDKRNSIFSLLVFAHYRTSPSDFKYILESDDVRIYSLEYKDNVLAVLLINQEGGFDQDLSRAIYRGERRPRGHLLAQTLSFHAGYEQAAMFKYARIMRIAVHPDIQFHGFGSYLLNEVVNKEKNLGMDVIGSSFSATKELLGFWSKADMKLLRIGFSRDHVSASNSAVVAMSLSKHSAGMVVSLEQKFTRNMDIWLQGPLSTISTNMQQYLSKYYNRDINNEDQEDIQDVESFALYNRNYEACLPAIVRWLETLKILPDELSDSEKQMINASLCYRNDWKLIVEKTKCSGKPQALGELRKALKHLLSV